ncbi:hypothetical protein DFQ30_008034 [Apophysomyces sp. BC1015]|nr:hypothetical protein DFQ30_008034 [Apophysomyces sp. BC1015]
MPNMIHDPSASLPATESSDREPSKAYIAISELPSTHLSNSPEQLLVLDLNGTFVQRYQNQGMFVRPHGAEFLDFIFQNFKVVVWSSAQPRSVDMMCRMFGRHRPKLLFEWDRTMFGLSEKEYYQKTQTVKDLRRIWCELSFDATNTIMLDDSPTKAILQPYNSVHLREFNHKSPEFKEHGESELCCVMEYLRKLRFESNVASYMRKHPYESPDPKTTERNSWECAHYEFAFSEYEHRVYDFKKAQHVNTENATGSEINGRLDRDERRHDHQRSDKYRPRYNSDEYYHHRDQGGWRGDWGEGHHYRDSSGLRGDIDGRYPHPEGNVRRNHWDEGYHHQSADERRGHWDDRYHRPDDHRWRRHWDDGYHRPDDSRWRGHWDEGYHLQINRGRRNHWDEGYHHQDDRASRGTGMKDTLARRGTNRDAGVGHTTVGAVPHQTEDDSDDQA